MYLFSTIINQGFRALGPHAAWARHCREDDALPYSSLRRHGALLSPLPSFAGQVCRWPLANFQASHQQKSTFSSVQLVRETGLSGDRSPRGPAGHGAAPARLETPVCACFAFFSFFFFNSCEGREEWNHMFGEVGDGFQESFVLG